MDGPPSAAFLDDPGVWTDLRVEMLHKDGVDHT
jgi:hypothetical protein